MAGLCVSQEPLVWTMTQGVTPICAILQTQGESWGSKRWRAFPKEAQAGVGTALGLSQGTLWPSTDFRSLHASWTERLFE